jgi:hypothetical protein
MRLDRDLILSRGEEAYWDRVRPLLGPDGCVAAVADLQMRTDHPREIPYSLLGAYNYPILARVRGVSGYSVTVPRDCLYVTIPPAVNIGLFSPAQIGEIFRERPNAKCLVLLGVQPLRIVLRSATGPDIDVMPFIPRGAEHN